ncbi:MAG: hypothetical protein R3E39_19860 [Anaerolineae bacterium]
MELHLKAFITESGEIKAKLPQNHPIGEVQLIIEVTEVTPIDEEPLTADEIAELMRPEPKTGAEIVALGHTGGWEHKGITDGVEWIEAQRRKRREQRGW